jgi:hypothetical protein
MLQLGHWPHLFLQHLRTPHRTLLQQLPQTPKRQSLLLLLHLLLTLLLLHLLLLYLLLLRLLLLPCMLLLLLLPLLTLLLLLLLLKPLRTRSVVCVHVHGVRALALAHQLSLLTLLLTLLLHAALLLLL